MKFKSEIHPAVEPFKKISNNCGIGGILSFSWIAALKLSKKLWNLRGFPEKYFMFKLGRFTEAFKFIVKLGKPSLWFPRDKDSLAFKAFLKTESISKMIFKICKEKSLEVYFVINCILIKCR